MKTVSLTVFCLVLVGFAQAEPIRNEPLPITHMILTENAGRIKILSSNARFELRGQLVDRWSGEVIDSADKAHKAFNYMDFSNIKFDVNELNPYWVGEGDKDVIVFVDPLCAYCKQLLSELPIGSRTHRFAVIPVGITGPQSMKLANELSCARDQQAAFAQLLTGQYSELRQVENCDNSDQFKRVLTAQMFGVRTVPFMLRDDGLIQRGLPKAGLDAWLGG
jgi:thiol:disulfide interchange protein DsbC